MKVVLHCDPAKGSESEISALEVQIDGDKLDAYVTVPGRPDRTRYDVKVWEDPSGYVGQYLELKIDEWDHVTTPASLIAQYPPPTSVSTFAPNLRARLACAWQ